jgi:hypothetical protein
MTFLKFIVFEGSANNWNVAKHVESKLNIITDVTEYYHGNPLPRIISCQVQPSLLVDGGGSGKRTIAVLNPTLLLGGQGRYRIACKMACAM